MGCGDWIQLLEEQGTPKVARPSLQPLNVHRSKIGMELCQLSCGHSLINHLHDFLWLIFCLKRSLFFYKQEQMLLEPFKG